MREVAVTQHTPILKGLNALAVVDRGWEVEVMPPRAVSFRTEVGQGKGVAGDPEDLQG
jgi:hypothetical protein